MTVFIDLTGGTPDGTLMYDHIYVFDINVQMNNDGRTIIGMRAMAGRIYRKAAVNAASETTTEH
jgi:hypothetical protein